MKDERPTYQKLAQEAVTKLVQADVKHGGLPSNAKPPNNGGTAAGEGAGLSTNPRRNGGEQ